MGPRRSVVNRKGRGRDLLALQAAERAQLAAPDGVHGGLAALAPDDMELGALPVDLIPAEHAELGDPEAVQVGAEDHGGVAVRVPTTPPPGGLHEPLDLVVGEILAGAAVAVGAAGRDCPVFASW